MNSRIQRSLGGIQNRLVEKNKMSGEVVADICSLLLLFLFSSIYVMPVHPKSLVYLLYDHGYLVLFFCFQLCLLPTDSKVFVS